MINRHLLLIILMFVIYQCPGQEDFNIQKSNNTQLIRVLNNQKLRAVKENSRVSIKIYFVDNGIASAGFPNSEVSHNILVAISEIDDAPRQNVFEIGPFYNPEFWGWYGNDQLERNFEIEYGPRDKRTSVQFNVNIDELKIIKERR